MANPNLIGAVYQALVNPNGRIFLKRWPNTPAGTNLVAGIKVTAGATPAYSAWTQIVAAAKLDAFSLITKIFLENPTTGGAAEVWGVDLAQGAGGAEVSWSNNVTPLNPLGIGTLTEAWSSSVGRNYLPPSIELSFPLLANGANGQPRIAAATAGLLVGSKDIFVAFQAAVGVGT